MMRGEGVEAKEGAAVYSKSKVSWYIDGMVVVCNLVEK